MCRDEANFSEIGDLEVVVGQDEMAFEKNAIASEYVQDSQQRKEFRDQERRM